MGCSNSGRRRSSDRFTPLETRCVHDETFGTRSWVSRRLFSRHRMSSRHAELVEASPRVARQAAIRKSPENMRSLHVTAAPRPPSESRAYIGMRMRLANKNATGLTGRVSQSISLLHSLRSRNRLLRAASHTFGRRRPAECFGLIATDSEERCLAFRIDGSHGLVGNP